jgi:hypothetical protein
MASRDGTYIKMYRKCLNNPIFRKKPYDKWHAWEYLLLNARNEPTEIMINNELITLQRGELFRSYHSMSETFGWSEKQVRNFISQLKVSKMLATSRHSKGQVLRIENYSLYQCEGQSKGQSKGNQGALKGQQRKNDKECKNNILCISANKSDELFNELWREYPRKQGKGSVSQKQKEKLFHIGKEEMLRAINRYKQQIESEHTEQKYIKMGSTFFNSGYVDYLDANYEESASCRKESVYPRLT